MQTFFPLDDLETGVDRETFDNWVSGESKRYIKRRMDDLQTDLSVAAAARAHFLTSLPSSRDLATVNLADQPSDSPVLKTLLKCDLPYLSDVALDELAKARRDESAFQEFRVALGKAVADIESVEDDKRQQCLDQAVQELIHAPLARIDRRLRSLRQNVFLHAAVAVGTLVTTILSSTTPIGATLLTLATIASASKAIASYEAEKNEEEKIREHPSYFYWKATKSARKRHKRR